MSTATLTIDQALVRVDEAVEKVKNDAEQRFPDAASVGDAVRQGDIYIQKIDDVTSTPRLYRELTEPKYPLQLAPGNTKGSRHMLEASDGATVYVVNTVDTRGIQDDDWEALREAMNVLRRDIFQLVCEVCKVDPETVKNSWGNVDMRTVEESITDALNFCGPIVNLTKEGKISHPEHGDWVLPPGSYRITFQRTITSDNAIRRVLD